METAHISVLKEEVIELLEIKPDGIYVDCTLGAGGHAIAILEKLTTGHLYAFDQDESAIAIATKRLAQVSDQFTIIQHNFEYLKADLAAKSVYGVDGILFDIGVSSMQLDQEMRGFSYRFDAPLDMRMNLEQELSAAIVVNTYSEKDLTMIFFKYGEESFSRGIARRIVAYRENKKIETTFELVEIIRTAIPMKKQKQKHPAKKVFQAIRIEVNNELMVFERALEQAIEILNPKGRIAVITFHSLEDKICKRIFNKYGKIMGPKNELEKLVKEAEIAPMSIITRKPLKASEMELAQNRRSQSAKLRVLEKK